MSTVPTLERSTGQPLQRLRKHLYILLPCAMLTLYAAPSVGYMLPAHRSYQGEDYQPLKTLRFFKTRGTTYHKYGPMTDFLLAPGYALSLAYWWLDGGFKNPSTDYPYGFERPLQQMGFLLLQGRILFLLLVLACSAGLMAALHSAGVSRTATALGFLLCFGTSWAVIYFSANTRPEAPQMAFTAASVAFYVRMLYETPTWKRAAWMSVFAALAVTAKELAATVFVLPYAGYALWLWLRGRDDADLRKRFWPIIGAGLAAGVGTYALFNIIYAPSAWWTRMEHWTSGSGLDLAVWVPKTPTPVEHALQVVGSLVSTLGPAGFAVALASLVVLLWRRPAGYWLLLLPFVSVLTLGLIQIGYGGDRFYTLACVTLVPPCAFGLHSAWEAAGGATRRLYMALAALALASNLLSATLSWHMLGMQGDYMIEADLRDNPLPRDKTLYMLDEWATHPSASRLGLLGYEVETRAAQEVIDGDRALCPDRIYASEGHLSFLEQAKRMPARAAVLREAGLRVDEWHGIEPLGYRRTRTLEPKTPWWFPFDWLPAVRYQTATARMVIFDRTTSS